MREFFRLLALVALCIVVYVAFRYHFHASTHTVRLHIP